MNWVDERAYRSDMKASYRQPWNADGAGITFKSSQTRKSLWQRHRYLAKSEPNAIDATESPSAQAGRSSDAALTPLVDSVHVACRAFTLDRTRVDQT
jgi:hypothetical protein